MGEWGWVWVSGGMGWVSGRMGVRILGGINYKPGNLTDETNLNIQVV